MGSDLEMMRCCVVGPVDTKFQLTIKSRDPKSLFTIPSIDLTYETTPKAFGIRSTEQRRDVGAGSDLCRRVEEHPANSIVRCLCFYEDQTVFKLIKQNADLGNPATPVIRTFRS